MSKLDDPLWRHSRAMKAGLVARARHAAQREAKGEQYPTKGIAYVAGYRTGYQRAMEWWRRKYRREGLRP